MDLDTFMTTLYVWIDDWYTEEMAEEISRTKGPAPKMSDSEVLTVAMAGQWRCGTPWSSERGVVRYMQREGKHWFPTMLERSRFNERVRCLWAVVVKLQQALARKLRSSRKVEEVVDCLPLPSCSTAQVREGRHWLWWGTYGHGGNHGGRYWGDQLIMSVTSDHVITGWLIGPAHVDDRVMLQALISARTGSLDLTTPKPWRPWRRLTPPSFILPLLAAGSPSPTQAYLADKGFNGYRWQQHWYQHYGVSVLTEPSRNAKGVVMPYSWRRWFRGLRQAVETTFSVLTTVFSIKNLNPHSRWGQITRVALATATYNWGIWLNRRMGRPDLSHASLF